MKHPIGTALCLAMVAAAFTAPSMAADLTVIMHKATQEGTTEALGTILIASSDAGATFTLHLHGFSPGPHGFHVHENANCGPTFLNAVRIPAGAAGGHLDPDETGRHEGPAGQGHLGDLPIIDVAADGTTNQTLIAPRIKDINVLKGHALVIHIGGDNYKDTPSLGGGGGGRFACGLIP
jgi:Cu-Zn family superoxide dismutase